MKGNRAAQRYARAILDLAKEQKAAEAVNKDMLGVSKVIAENEELQAALSSPVVKPEEKRNVLKEVFKDAHATTLGTFDLLLENKRIPILKSVAQKYTELYNEMNNIRIATVTTAVPLDASMEEKILNKIKELTGESAVIESKVDPEIIGGFILRIGDLQYNASVSHNLDKLKREMKSNAYISKI